MESIKSDIWDTIPNSVKMLNELFKSKGKKLYLVGGSIRDFLMGDIPKDFDLVTDALPDEVIDILDGKFKTNLQGKSFGVVVVFTKDQPMGMEIATFREDLSKGRNPEVKLGVTIEDDVKRRDLTYNSLFYDLDSKVIVDLVGGREDLFNGITRMVGNPIERFDEDSLRILRAFRFASRYQHPLHKDTESAIFIRKQLQNIDQETGVLKRISQERIWEEIKKAWCQSKDFKYYLNFFTKFDMWNEVFPNLNINTNLVDSSDFIVVLSNLFRNEEPNGLENRLVQDFKIDLRQSKQIVLLLDILKLKVDCIYDLYKKKEQSFITEETIKEWLRVNSINEPLKVMFIDYRPTTSSYELMDKGFKGIELGKEIKRLEIEKINNIVKLKL